MNTFALKGFSLRKTQCAIFLVVSEKQLYDANNHQSEDFFSTSQRG